MKDSRLRYSLAKSTNKEDFLQFLKEKIDNYSSYPRSTVLVMDNHRAHHSKVVTEWLAEKQYVSAFLPVYSSEFNPIERVWAMLKHEWAQTLIRKDFEARMVSISRPIR